jgi:hypothetical protein
VKVVGLEEVRGRIVQVIEELTVATLSDLDDAVGEENLNLLLYALEEMELHGEIVVQNGSQETPGDRYLLPV